MNKLPYSALVWDIEVSPNFGAFYDRWETNPIDISQYQVIMSFSVKRLDTGKIVTKGLIDYPNWKRDKFDDSALCQELWQLMNGVELQIGHNIVKFDMKKLNARFAVHGLRPIRPYKTIDTLTLARRKFGFIGNSLNDLGKQLGVGGKTKKTHSDLWKDCLEGNRRAWREMKVYNENDIVVTEKIYRKLLPFIERFPVIQRFNNRCSSCGSKLLKKNGVQGYATGKWRQRWECIECGFSNTLGLINTEDDWHE